MRTLGCPLLLLASCMVDGRLYSALDYNESISMLRQLEMGGDVLSLEDVSPLAKSKPLCFGQQLCSINPLAKVTASSNSPAVLFSGTIHGDERLGSAITLYLAEYLTQEYRKNNTYIQWLLARREVHLLPFVNLDGFIYNHRHDYEAEKPMDPSTQSSLQRRVSKNREQPSRRQLGGAGIRKPEEARYASSTDQALGSGKVTESAGEHRWKSFLRVRGLSQSSPAPVAVDARPGEARFGDGPSSPHDWGVESGGGSVSQLSGLIHKLDVLRRGRSHSSDDRKSDAIKTKTKVKVDANRDFPYLNGGCPKSVSGQALYQLIMNKLYVAGITFHGGMRSLTYNWGGPNHLTKQRSTESPDDAMQRFIAKELQEAAGIIPLSEPRRPRGSEESDLLSLLQAKDATQKVSTEVLMAYKPHLFSADPNPNYAYFYPIARTNDLVYPVNGSVEDWAYGGGWEDSSSEMEDSESIVSCKREGYERHLRFPFFLVETDDDKSPKSKAYGDRVDVNYLTAYSGHIPRNIRMCLRLIEMLEPEVAMSYRIISLGRMPHDMKVNSPVIGNGDIQDLFKALRHDLNNSFEIITAGEEHERTLLFLNLYFTGCQSVTNINVYVGIDLLYRDTNHYVDLCSSFGGLKMTNFQRYNVILTLPPSVSGPVLVSAEFDKEWGHQVNPDPRGVKPQSHLVKIRLQPDYEVTGNQGDSLSSNVTQFYPKIVFKKSQYASIDKDVVISLLSKKSEMTLSFNCRNVGCTATCVNCSRFSKQLCHIMSKQGFGRAKQTGWIYIHEVSSFTEHPLFKVPLEDGRYEGRLEDRVDVSGGAEPPRVNVAIGCGRSIIKIKALDQNRSCWSINEDLTVDDVTDKTCPNKTRDEPQTSRTHGLLGERRDLILVSFFNLAAFLVWLSVIVASFTVFRK